MKLRYQMMTKLQREFHLNANAERDYDADDAKPFRVHDTARAHRREILIYINARTT